MFNPAWATPKRDDEDNDDDDGSTKASGPETARSTESDAEIVAIRMHFFVLVSSSKSHSSFSLFSEREKLSLDDDFNDFGEVVDVSARRKKGARRDDDDALVRDLELVLNIAVCLIIILGVVVVVDIVVVVVIIPLLSVRVLFSILFKGIWSEKSG